MPEAEHQSQDFRREVTEIPARPVWFKSRVKAPEPDPAPERWWALWLTNRDVIVCLVLGTILLILLTVDWVRRSSWNQEPISIERSTRGDYVYRIDLNRASWVEFAQLDGIGPALGHRIVDDRRKQGPFLTVDDLDRVKGIGPKTLERLRPHLRVELPREWSRRRPRGL